MSNTPEAGNSADLQEAFPVVDPGAVPLGARVLVQMRLPKRKMTSSGIILAAETVDTEKAQNPIGKVVAVGPLAFKKRDTMEPWPEGTWVEVGDYVRVPRWTGDRWEVPVSQDDVVQFMLMNDHEVVAKLTSNPLEMRAFV
jgi:co-chaperonin GroES (HSP10)